MELDGRARLRVGSVAKQLPREKKQLGKNNPCANTTISGFSLHYCIALFKKIILNNKNGLIGHSIPTVLVLF